MNNEFEYVETTDSTYESLFERILAYRGGDEKARTCARKLFERYGSLATILSERESEIVRNGETDMNTALLIKLIGYLNSRRVTDSFECLTAHTEMELRELISSLFTGLSVETIYAILLDDMGRVKSWEYISEGTVNASDVIPRKILECARKRKSKNIILAHNHPKGTSVPSKDDIMTTGRLFNLFASVGIRLCAHYIVADGDVGRIETDMLYNPDYNTTAKW